MFAGPLVITSGIYVAQNFKNDTDINKLISPDFHGASRNWRFPGHFPSTPLPPWSTHQLQNSRQAQARH